MAEFRGIIRIASKDLKGELPLPKALYQLKGIGSNLADSLATIASQELKITKNEKIGNLDEQQLKTLEEIIRNPGAHGMPNWMLNRKKDLFTGNNSHLIMSDLDFRVKQDVEHLKDAKCYRGVRHMFGLRVRGQRTKNCGRKGATLGVIKKKEMPAKAKPTSVGGGKK